MVLTAFILINSACGNVGFDGGKPIAPSTPKAADAEPAPAQGDKDSEIPSIAIEDEPLTPPVPIAGTYLSCQTLNAIGETSATIGCHFENEAGTKLDIDPAAADITLESKTLPNADYKVTKASLASA